MKTLRVISLVVAASLWGGAAVAQSDHERIRKEVQSGKLKPLAEILSTVQQRYPGRVVDIDLERGVDGRRWYEIKLLNGQRTTLYIDAVTGQEIPKPEATTSPLLSMPTVVRNLLASYAGIVLEVELESDTGQPPYYEFKLLSRDGREESLRVDARSGQVLHEPRVQSALASRLMPLDRILESLEKKYQGRATEAELKTHRTRRTYYEIELLQGNGRSLEVHVDAISGEVLGEEALR